MIGILVYTFLIASVLGVIAKLWWDSQYRYEAVGVYSSNRYWSRARHLGISCPNEAMQEYLHEVFGIPIQ